MTSTTKISATVANSPAAQTRRMAMASMASAIAAGWSGSAFAQDFPNKPIKLLVIAAPGGLPDTVARVLGQQLQKSFGTPVVIENRAGAGGNIATLAVARAPADGYTLLITGNNHAVNPTLLPNPGFDYNKDVVPLSLLVDADMLLVSSPSFVPTNLTQLVSYARANPGKVSIAISPVGTPNHLGAELLAKLGGLDLNFIAYKGIGQAMPDLISGRVDLAVSAISSVMPMVTAGKLKPLAVLSPARSLIAPQIPTAAEAGLPGLDVGAWICIMATGGTPKPVIARLNSEIVKVMAQPEVKAQMLDQGVLVHTTSPEALGAYIRKEEVRWSDVLKTAKVRE